MKYFFILGNNPSLSVAEILAIFPKYTDFTLISQDVFLLKLEENLSKETINRLGGTIKFGQIIFEAKEKDLLGSLLSLIELNNIKEKFHFGISVYGPKLATKPLGMEIKNYIKEAGYSARFVVGRDQALSSVIVEQNYLLDKGMEFILISYNNTILLGNTIAVQPFKSLSFRDYGRPGRDDRSGMLPPKLAQILINLSISYKENSTLLDPFCGSGTILTEAMLLGIKNLIGSDSSEKAIADTKKNIKWISKNYKIPDLNYQLFCLSAAELTKTIASDSIDAIATEPYLGPQRGSFELHKVINELNGLYTKALSEFYKILKPGSRIAMIWPIFNNQKSFLNPNLGKLKIINLLPDSLKNNKLISLTKRQTIIYGRPGQKVFREIVVLEK